LARVEASAEGVEEWDEAAPRPKALVESLRSFGYSPETAIADLLDNSISAGASEMVLHFEWAGSDSHLAIVDDGRGMDEATLLEAMRPGSISPLSTRAASDLGRFGLGLKTASFAQARELTVITRDASGQAHVRRWDLDLVGTSGQWRLLRLPSAQAAPYLSQVTRTGGTAVVWSKCDRLVGDVEHDPERAADRFYAVVDQVRTHLGATFHRFLAGRGARSIRVNDVAVQPWDPILKHPATHLVTTEKLPFRGTRVEVKAYVLPHRSKLSEQQQQAGAGIRGWNAQQGFYVYRNKRLVVSGDWLGVGGAKDEHTKLGRITIDFDSELDLDWQIDVKKSTDPRQVLEGAAGSHRTRRAAGRGLRRPGDRDAGRAGRRRRQVGRDARRRGAGGQGAALHGAAARLRAGCHLRYPAAGGGRATAIPAS